MTNPLEPMMADLIARIERGVPPWRQAWVACADPSLPLRSDGQTFTGSNAWLLSFAGAMGGYQAAVHGAIHLAPDGEARAVLGADYEAMVADGLLFDDAEPFDQLMAHCLELEGRINAAMHPAP